eukprot:TRINITY_DN14146_c0_g1_i1.p1 TRINITY_DN14146_c0_g1~~TRINITY_DN14146_c0_g1_i1.p1  ORF type:complete len:518 (+),score=145.10 TRINITY_DN14146_c0_g1_i1:77-1630(+)
MNHHPLLDDDQLARVQSNRRSSDGSFHANSPLGTPHGSPGMKPLKHRYTMAIPSEKQLKDVEVKVCKGMMAGFARKIDGNSKLQRRVTAMMGNFAGPQDAQDEHPSATQEGLQTNGEAMVNLLNNCLGSGMLGIAYSIAQTGVLVGLVSMLVSLLLNKFTLLLHQDTCKIAVADPSSAEIAEKTFGNAGKIFMSIFYTFFGFFCMVSMVDGSADSLEGILKAFLPEESLPTPMVNLVGVWFFLLLPPTLVRSLKSVATLSFVAFMGGLVVIGAVIIACVGILMSNGLPDSVDVKLSCDAATFFKAFPILLLVFSIQAGGGVVLATMQDTRPENITRVTNRTYLLVFVMDATIGLLAYFTFLDKTQSDVIKNLPGGSIVSLAGRIGLLILLVLSYMIMCIPCKFAMIELFFHKNEAMMEASSSEFYSIVLVLNLAALAVAISVSDLGLILGLNGAVCTNTCAFLLPVAFNLKAKSNPANPDYEPVPIFSKRNIGYHLLFVFGVVSTIVSSTQVLKSFF